MSSLWFLHDLVGAPVLARSSCAPMPCRLALWVSVYHSSGTVWHTVYVNQCLLDWYIFLAYNSSPSSLLKGFLYL